MEVDALCPRPKNLPETKLKSFELMTLAEKISREPNIYYVIRFETKGCVGGRMIRSRDFCDLLEVGLRPLRYLTVGYETGGLSANFLRSSLSNIIYSCCGVYPLHAVNVFYYYCVIKKLLLPTAVQNITRQEIQAEKEREMKHIQTDTR